MKLFFKEFMKWKHLKWLSLMVLLCFGVYLCGVRIEVNSGPSAKPTYHEGDITLGIKTKNVTYGDYISIDGFEKHILLHKRVIAMPGDHLTIHDSVVTINGTKLKEDYLAPINHRFTGEVDMVLGEDEYFVMGDNRRNSYDSRNFGPIKKEQIWGKTIARVGVWFIIIYQATFVVLLYFPLKRFFNSFFSSSASDSETAANFGSTK